MPRAKKKPAAPAPDPSALTKNFKTLKVEEIAERVASLASRGYQECDGWRPLAPGQYRIAKSGEQAVLLWKLSTEEAEAEAAGDEPSLGPEIICDPPEAEADEPPESALAARIDHDLNGKCGCGRSASHKGRCSARRPAPRPWPMGDPSTPEPPRPSEEEPQTAPLESPLKSVAEAVKGRKIPEKSAVAIDGGMDLLGVRIDFAELAQRSDDEIEAVFNTAAALLILLHKLREKASPPPAGGEG